MRSQWTNLILHVTALLNRKKQQLLISHAFTSVFLVVTIVFLELFLAIISIPLYLVSSDFITGDRIQYRIRRVISLTILIVILIVWLFKIIFIVALPLYFDTRQSFFISEQPVNNGTLGYLISDVYNVASDSNLPAPLIKKIAKATSGNLIIEGTGSPNTEAIVVIGKRDEKDRGEIIEYFTNKIDYTGNWSIGVKGERLSLVSGDYWLQVMSYDNTAKVKSELGPEYSFSVGPNWINLVSGKIDIYLNYFVIIFLILGILSIVILI